MTFLRHAARHVHHTVANYVEAQLTELNWLSDTPPFGAQPVAIRRTAAFLGSELVEGIGAGTITITLGDEVNPDPEELGGPLTRQDYPIFIDVFQDSEAVTLALATDVRDALLGRFPTSRRFLPVVDQATGLEVPGWTMEFDDVERITPDRRLPLPWQAVHVTAACYFQEVRY